MVRSTLPTAAPLAIDGSGAKALDALDEIFAFRNGDDVDGRDEVRAYLVRYPELVPVVIEASERIQQFLPSAHRPVLELVPYPEDEAGEGTLFAVAQTELGWEEVRPRLDRLRRDWLRDVSQRVEGSFNVGVDYV